MSSHSFSERHQGKKEGEEIRHILKTIAAKDIPSLIQETIPENILLDKNWKVVEAASEEDFLSRFQELLRKNILCRSFIGKGYYTSFLPSVIRRQVLENPAWYTAYTPYQSEISQGRLEALLNFQTLISELTGLPLSNASLLDEATACAEAMLMTYRAREDKAQNVFLVDRHIFPQTLDVLLSRAEPLGIEIQVQTWSKAVFSSPYVFAALCQYPNSEGEVLDHRVHLSFARKQKIQTVMCSNPLALTLFTSPGELGANIAVGSTQILGLPIGFGGPHAAYLAAQDKYKRLLPGRIIGISQDKEGNDAYRMALQTREQHIRRGQATSNICTSQVLLAIISSFYAIYHGPKGLQRIAERIRWYTYLLVDAFQQLPLRVIHTKKLFQTILLEVEDELQVRSVKTCAEQARLNFDYPASRHISISLDEATNLSDLNNILNVFSEALGIPCPVVNRESKFVFSEATQRTDSFLN
ncbi:MAG: glycine dehydrogenase (aminomethyl-transferring), partial [Cytophagales bacterium]|nr:glycine dehydrogenase (aminomethyl-transferring) [Cytophagales bacterium]